jgi:hypothetical protein
MMHLSTIARASAFAGLLVACGAGGSGAIEGNDDPGGPFSGVGPPGSSLYNKPGVFSGYGPPGTPGVIDVSGLFGAVCQRLRAICPATNSHIDACVAQLQSQWAKLTSDCARSQVYAFWTCVLADNITCNSRGEATPQSCAPPSFAQCGDPISTGGAGGTGTAGAGGTSGGGGGTGGAGATGGTGGAGTGGTGGTGGGTGGSGGTGGGTGGTGGTGGGGRGGRDAGRG